MFAKTVQLDQEVSVWANRTNPGPDDTYEGWYVMREAILKQALDDTLASATDRSKFKSARRPTCTGR